jgi:hypothetical protein
VVCARVRRPTLGEPERQTLLAEHARKVRRDRQQIVDDQIDGAVVAHRRQDRVVRRRSHRRRNDVVAGRHYREVGREGGRRGDRPRQRGRRLDCPQARAESEDQVVLGFARAQERARDPLELVDVGGAPESQRMVGCVHVMVRVEL